MFKKKQLNVHLVKCTACMQMTDAKEEASLCPDLPNKARVSQARALIGFQLTGADEEQKNIEGKGTSKNDRLKNNTPPLTNHLQHLQQG